MLELELGGGRKLSKFSTVRMLYSIGIQVVGASLVEKYIDCCAPILELACYSLMSAEDWASNDL